MSEVSNKKLKSPNNTDSPSKEDKIPSLIRPDEIDLEGLKGSKEFEKKVNALKNIQLKLLEVESKFYEDLHELECRYSKLYEPFYEKRRQIIVGEYVPTEEEGKWALDELNGEEEEEKKENNEENGHNVDNATKKLLHDIKTQLDTKHKTDDSKGVSNFWLETLQSFRIIAETIQEHDEPILAYLQDIKCKLFEQKPYGYTLEFYFSENPYFSNKVLTKTYELKTEIDPKDPFSFEGPDLNKATGCKIDWKQGKNVTVKIVSKKLKSRNKKVPPKLIQKEEKQDSFFNFFETPKPPKSKNSKSPASSGAEDGGKKDSKKQLAIKSKHDDDDDEDDEEEDQHELFMIADFEIGQYIREKVIPKAILYFTGEFDELDEEYDEYEDEDDEGDEDDEEDEDEDEEDEDEEEEEDHGKKGGKHGKKHNSNSKSSNKNAKTTVAKPGEPTPSECKQN